MKKGKWLITTLALPCAILPLNTFVSCSKLSQLDRIMNNVLTEFYEICKHPHPSYNLDEIRGYLFERARIVFGATAQRDDYGNMWFDIPANNVNYKDYPELILQAHMDMVFAGNEEDKFKPIIPQYHKDGNYLTSKDNKTSLGADDGIGIATIFALLKDDSIKHGPIRALITADEEVGMLGASQLTTDALNSDYLISLDGELEGPGGVYVSCAGGAVYKLNYKFSPVAKTGTQYKIVASGFKGGHSGNDIGKLRGNAERFIFEGLYKLKDGLSLQLASFNHGGQEFANNALIPYAECVFNSSKSEQDIEKTFDNLVTTYKNKYKDDQDIEYTLVKDPQPSIDLAIGVDNSAKIVKMIGNDLKYGVIPESEEPVLHPDRSANIGPTIIENGDLTFEKYDRGTTVQMVKEDIETDIINAFQAAGFTDAMYELVSEVLPWEENPSDKIINLVKRGYEAVGVEPQEKRTNGGVEPSKFITTRPHMNQTCIGAKFIGVHSTSEQCYLDVLKTSIQSLIYVIDHMGELDPPTPPNK